MNILASANHYESWHTVLLSPADSSEVGEMGSYNC